MPQTSEVASYTNLVIVCCHAIYLGSPSSTSSDPYEESSWALQDFQKGTDTKQGEHETFLHQAQFGLDMTCRGTWSNKSILVISGGRTKSNITQLSESQSYYNALLSASDDIRARAEHAYSKGALLLEQYATDSYQNLLFSIIQFRKQTGRYPQNIQVVTNAFKARRFLELHANAIRWPETSITVSGIDPPMDWNEYKSTTDGEALRGYMPWTIDTHGIRHPLHSKRVARGWDPSINTHLANGVEGTVHDLLHWDGGQDGFCRFPPEVRLPWELNY